MTALFPDPVRGALVRGEDEILIIGVTTLTSSAGAVSVSDIRLIVNDGAGGMSLASIDDVVTHWRYGTIPDGPKAGQLGWYDWRPEGEPPPEVNPIDFEEDPLGLD